MGESLVEDAVGESLFELGEIEIGYCARPGEVDLRIIGESSMLDRAETIITNKLGKTVFSKADESLEEVVVRLLTQKKQTLAVAESCTGGFLANRITNVPGASNVFLAGFVTYSNEAKTEMLGVEPQLISTRGAVSEEVARSMAECARRRANSTFALATTGIAGPGGGTKEKPVGTLFVALSADNAQTQTRNLFFPMIDPRLRN
jgi:nicotinamide-nucleotide amidase